MKAAFISGGYLGLIAQVVIAAVNFTFVDCKSSLWQCLTLILVTGRFDGTRCNKSFPGNVSRVSMNKSFAAGFLIRRTSHFYLVGGTVSPTLRWRTRVALETISCIIIITTTTTIIIIIIIIIIIKGGSLLHSQLSMSRQATLTFPGFAEIPAFDLWYKLQAVRYFSVSRDEAWQDLACVTGVWKESSLRAVSHPDSLSLPFEHLSLRLGRTRKTELVEKVALCDVLLSTGESFSHFFCVINIYLSFSDRAIN